MPTWRHGTAITRNLSLRLLRDSLEHPSNCVEREQMWVLVDILGDGGMTLLAGHPDLEPERAFDPLAQHGDGLSLDFIILDRTS
jgi:hypothetical protein